MAALLQGSMLGPTFKGAPIDCAHWPTEGTHRRLQYFETSKATQVAKAVHKLRCCRSNAIIHDCAGGTVNGLNMPLCKWWCRSCPTELPRTLPLAAITTANTKKTCKRQYRKRTTTKSDQGLSCRPVPAALLQNTTLPMHALRVLPLHAASLRYSLPVALPLPLRISCLWLFLKASQRY